MNSKVQGLLLGSIGLSLLVLLANAMITANQMKNGEKDIHTAQYVFCVLCVLLFIGPVFAVATRSVFV